MVKRALVGTPTTPVSPLLDENVARGSAFHTWMSIFREEHALALVATAGANAERRHHAAVRSLYVPAAPDQVH